MSTPRGRIVATVWCGQCDVERRPDPGRLAQVREWPHGPHPFHVLEVLDYRPARWMRDRGWERNNHLTGYLLDHPDPAVRVEIPETVEVFCRYHGNARVLTRAVADARGNLVAKLITATT